MSAADPADRSLDSRAGRVLALLGRVTVGRLGVPAAGEAPLIVPVNFVLDGDDVVRDHWVRLRPRLVTGRRIRLHLAPTDQRGYR